MIRLALVGTGGIAHTHARRFGEIRGCKLVACADVVAGKAAAFAGKNSVPAAYDDPDEMLKTEKLDAVSIASSDSAHCENALAAVGRGLHVLCEKPLADNLRDARRMEAAARKKGVLTAVNFSYRDRRSTQEAARLVARGRIGRVVHVEGRYLQSWLSSKVWGDWRKSDAWLWRLSTRHGSMGCLGDVGVHLYDLASFVAGEIAEIHCDLKTFDKGVREIGPYVLDANDAFVSSVRFKNGAVGTLHSSRWATGHVNTVGLRVHGDEGALELNLDRDPSDQLRVCIGPKARNSAKWEPLRCPRTPDIYQRFVTAVRTGEACQTGFAVGAKVQACLEASLVSSREGKYVRVK